MKRYQLDEREMKIKRLFERVDILHLLNFFPIQGISVCFGMMAVMFISAMTGHDMGERTLNISLAGAVTVRIIVTIVFNKIIDRMLRSADPDLIEDILIRLYEYQKKRGYYYEYSWEQRLIRLYEKYKSG